MLLLTAELISTAQLNKVCGLTGLKMIGNGLKASGSSGNGLEVLADGDALRAVFGTKGDWCSCW